MKKKIKLFDPSVNLKEEKKIIKTLRSHYWASGSGDGQVSEFEEKLKNYVDADSCVAVNNGTSALHLSLSMTDIKNKEVIIPSLSFVSTAHAVKYNGGIPCFVDIDPHTLCIDIKQVKEKISKNTKVLLPVHFGGFPANLEELTKLCKKENLLLIEDAAHAIGSSYKNKKIGSHGKAVCFSFHPVKNLAMPTGGLIALNGINHKKIKKELQSKRWCGITNRKNTTYDVSYLGWNMYMNEFSAAIGLVQIEKLDFLNNKRKRIARQYNKEITLNEKMPFNKECSYHLYWIRVKNRSKFISKMKNVGIETGIHYHPIHQMSFYKSKLRLPITEKIGQEIVSIPIHPNLTNNDVCNIIKYVNKFS